MACPPPDNASVCRPRSVYLAQDTTYTYSVLSDDNGAFYRVQELCDGVPTDAFTDYDLDWVAYTAVGTVTGPTSGGGGGGDASATNQTTEIARLTSILGAVDGVETLLTAIDGHVDGIEGLLATTNASLTTIDGHVDGIETLLGTTNSSLSTIDGHVDGLEGAIGAAADAAASSDTGTFSLIALVKRMLSVTLGSLTETAPASDTASSGLNGRSQRIAQRLTSLIALLPAALGQTTKTASLSVSIASDDDLQSKLGSLTETAPASDTASSGLNGRAQRIAQRLTSLIGLLPGSIGQKAKATSLAVSLATDEDLLTYVGTVTETAPASDTASSGLNGRLQRIAQRLTTIIAGLLVYGSGAIVKVALTVTASSYTSGNSIGGKITIANAVRVSGGVSVLTNIQLLDRANQRPTGTIYIFDADPSAATLTDKTAFVFSTDDLKVVAQIPVASTDWVQTNSKATATLPNLAREVGPVTGTTLYAAFVTTSTPTFAATTDMQMVFGLVYVN
jgi:hypothetical protein